MSHKFQQNMLQHVQNMKLPELHLGGTKPSPAPAASVSSTRFSITLRWDGSITCPNAPTWSSSSHLVWLALFFTSSHHPHKHYITVHYTTLPCVTLHCTALHYIALHYIALTSTFTLTLTLQNEH